MAYSNVQLSQGQQVRLNFTLNVGAVAQTVEVVAEANTLLATTTASVGDVLTECSPLDPHPAFGHPLPEGEGPFSRTFANELVRNAD